MRLLKALALSLVPSLALAGTKYIVNPQTNRPDYVAPNNNSGWPANASGCLSNDGSGNMSYATCSGGGGGGSASLQVTRSGIEVTSPTASINLNSQGFITGAVGSTSTIALNPATTDFIHNQSTLQTASFNLSSGVVNSFYVNSSSAGMSIVASSSTVNMHHAGFVLPYRHYAYVTASGSTGVSGSLTVFDVSNATSPVILKQLTNGYFMDMESMDIQGKYLYAASFGSHTVVAFDISAPANPIQIGTLTDNTNLTNIEQLRIVGNYIYASANGTGFSVIDISNPTAMKFLAKISILHALSVQVRYPYAYVTQNDNNCKLYVIDISTPSSPTTVTTFNPHSCTDSLSGSDFYGQYMYIGSNTGNNIYVLNVSSPSAPVFVSSVSAGAFQPLTLRVMGPYLYFSSVGENTISQYSLVTPSTPTVVNRITDNTNLIGPDDLYFNGSYLFTSLQGTGNSGGIGILNIGNMFTQSATFGSAQTDELEVTHDATINRLTAGTSVTSPFIAASGYLSGNITTLSSNTYVAGSTFTQANNGQLSIGQINWNGGNTQTNYIQGVVSPGTFTWTNTQGISVSTLTVTTLSNTQIPYITTGGGFLGSSNLQWDNSNQALNLNGASDTSVGLNVGCGPGNYCAAFDNNQGGSNELLGFTRSASQEGRFGVLSTGSPDSGPMWSWRLSGSKDLMTLDDTDLLSIPGNGGGGLSVTYGVAVGSMTGAGLSSCSGASNALTWNSSTSKFGCNAISTAGGGVPTLAVSTGTSSFSSPISSPTANVVFDSANHKGSLLLGGTTAFITLDPSSVTLRGAAWATSVDSSTGTLTTNLFATSSSTGTIMTRVINIGTDTGTITSNLFLTSTSTGTIMSRAVNLGTDTGTITSNLFSTSSSTGIVTISTGSTTFSSPIAVKAPNVIFNNAVFQGQFLTGSTVYITSVSTLTAASLGALTGNQSITLSGDSTGSGTTAITVVAAGTQANITNFSHVLTMTSSVTVNSTMTVYNIAISTQNSSQISTGTPVSLTLGGLFISTSGVQTISYLSAGETSLTIPKWAKIIRLRGCGAGGGGAAGSGKVATNTRGAGSGGGGGACIERNLDVTYINPTFIVHVASAGTGGSNVAADPSSGTVGMYTSVYAVNGSTYLYAFGGGGGAAAVSSSTAGGGGGGSCGPGAPATNAASIAGGCPSIGVAAGAGTAGGGSLLASVGLPSDWGGSGGGGSNPFVTGGSAGGSSVFGSGAGGGGGPVTVANAALAAGAGGGVIQGSQTVGAAIAGGGGAAGTSGASSTAGTNGADGNAFQGATGGGGGGGDTDSAGGAGGNGGICGGGGGGGGGGTSTGGVGGTGGVGCVFITFF